MVNRLLIAVPLLLLLSPTSATAQDSTSQMPPRDSAVRNQYRTWPDGGQSPGVMIGPMVGLNLAKFGGEDVGDVDTRTGFQAGIYASLPLGKVVAIAPSLAYSQEGTKGDVGGGVTTTFKLSYLELPVMLKLSAPLQGSGKIRPYVMAGPAVAFELSCRLEASNGSQSASADCDDDQVNLDTRKVLFGVHFGAGIEIDRVFIGAKYQLGLTSLDDTGGVDVKNRVIAIMAGYGFRLGH